MYCADEKNAVLPTKIYELATFERALVFNHVGGYGWEGACELGFAFMRLITAVAFDAPPVRFKGFS
jgi:hypothetical protein